MNEFRTQLNRQAGTFVTRELFDQRTATVNTALNDMSRWQSNIEGRLVMLASVPTLIAIAASIVAIWAAVR